MKIAFISAIDPFLPKSISFFHRSLSEILCKSSMYAVRRHLPAALFSIYQHLFFHFLPACGEGNRLLSRSDPHPKKLPRDVSRGSSS